MVISTIWANDWEPHLATVTMLLMTNSDGNAPGDAGDDNDSTANDGGCDNDDDGGDEM